jgi:hypothetical protein
MGLAVFLNLEGPPLRFRARKRNGGPYRFQENGKAFIGRQSI